MVKTYCNCLSYGDNAVYRAGFATSRRAARQLVGHGHFELNGRRVDIPSIRVLKPVMSSLSAQKAQNLVTFYHY